jgi:hypothetical protein
MATASTHIPVSSIDRTRARAFGLRLPCVVPPAPAPDPTPEPAGRCSLTLTINFIKYSVRPMPKDFGTTRKFKLTGPTGHQHVLSDGLHGPHCNCLDAKVEPGPCVHLRAARACGLID